LAYNRKILPGEFLELEISNNTDDSTFAELKLKVKLPTDVIKEKSEIFKWEYFENNVIISEKDETSEFKGFVKNNEKLEDLFLNYDYLKALRTEPEEEYPFKNEEYKKIGLKGENTYHILIKSTINQDGVFESVSNWYKNNFENWSLEINDYQIFNSKGKPVSFEKMAAATNNIDLVLFGEFHDNPIAHWLQLELTQRMWKNGGGNGAGLPFSGFAATTLFRYFTGKSIASLLPGLATKTIELVCRWNELLPRHAS
jgi:hypothetical protein